MNPCTPKIEFAWPSKGQQAKEKEGPMTKKVYIVIASLVLMGTFAISAQAQSRSRQEIRVNVPFAFNVANTTLPAGDYRVSIVNPSSDRSVLRIAGTEGTKVMVLTTDIKGHSKTNARLAFRRYGSQYFLAQVWMAAEPLGLATPHSRIEKQLQRQLGNGSSGYSMVAVNAR